jgi:hypothetical protein
MAGTKNPPTLRAAALGALFASLLGLLASTGCASEPCIGPGCPGPCGGVRCDDDEPAKTGGTSGTVGGGRFTACSSDLACDLAHGFSCVAGKCRHPCRSHFECLGAGTCAPLAETGATFCEPLAAPPAAGGYNTNSPRGTECTAAGFVCLGAGVGDLDAYCSGTCAADGDCPSGVRRRTLRRAQFRRNHRG